MVEVPSSIPTGGNFSDDFLKLSLCNPLMLTLPILCNYEKTMLMGFLNNNFHYYCKIVTKVVKFPDKFLA